MGDMEWIFIQTTDHLTQFLRYENLPHTEARSRKLITSMKYVKSEVRHYIANFTNHDIMNDRVVDRHLASIKRRRNRCFSSNSLYCLFLILAVLVVIWLVISSFIVWNLNPFTLPFLPSSRIGKTTLNGDSNESNPIESNPPQQQRQEHPLTLPQNLSRISGKVFATADVRGNLGPVSVVVQAIPGTDWLHDRWQAASNMHGKTIPGEHWIQLEFTHPIVVDSIRLDWETAFASEYRIEGSLKPTISTTPEESGQVWALFDASNPADLAQRTEEASGQSPGVKQSLPLHVVHNIKSVAHNKNNRPLRYLRLHILKPATGWGVSLWQFDVFGFWADEVVL
jgi:hypothetical protein